MMMTTALVLVRASRQLWFVRAEEHLNCHDSLDTGVPVHVCVCVRRRG